MKKYNIIQVGSFDVENFGDLLFPIVLEHELGKRLPLDHLYLFSPNGGEMPFYHRHVYPASDLDDFCQNHSIDGVIIGGGDTIRLDETVMPAYGTAFFPALSFWQYPILIADKYRTPSVFNSPGVPFDLADYQNINYQNIVNSTIRMCSYLSVRDACARENLIDSNSPDVHVVMDSVALINNIYSKKSLEPKFLELKKKHHLESSFIVIQLSRIYIDKLDFLNRLVKIVEIINKKHNLQVVFSPIGYIHKDLDTLHELHSKVSSKNIIIEEKMSPETMLSLFYHSQGFIGTSLHGLITSTAYHVPILALHDGQNAHGYSKIQGFIDLCHFENRIASTEDDVVKIFEQSFFQPVDFTHFNNERKKISHHFDRIAKIITSHEVIADPNNFISLLDSLYSLIKQNQIKSEQLIAKYSDYDELKTKAAKYDELRKTDIFSNLEVTKEKLAQYDSIINSGLWKKSQGLRNFFSKFSK
ncbi:polysaccharide pyruvyl transferase family protein [Candidatus Saccharibacteria bacterium]|nr:polysaccharide pyruvyl transferase family protein [Candidatus Saccharibacteria bacterium]